VRGVEGTATNDLVQTSREELSALPVTGCRRAGSDDYVFSYITGV
jgi:hypothetical protein